MFNKIRRTGASRLLMASMAIAMTGQAHAAGSAPANLEEMWTLLQAQQQQIQALQAQLQQAEQKISITDEKIEATGVMVEESIASSSGNWADKTTLGGYGEIHLNQDRNDAGEATDEIDAHRFVLYFGHEFTDKLRLFAELELEHGFIADTGGNTSGEVELEQAYIEGDINDNLSARAGVFLVPVGIMNETHEPPTFYGVERNQVEKAIIPATWWGGGIGLSGRNDNGISWDLALQEGLSVPVSGGSTLRVRSGRNKTAKASANNPAITGRLKYTGVPGLEVAASLRYESDVSQVGGDGLDSATLLETHVVYNNGPFGLRALYAQWDLDATAAVTATASGSDADSQKGWYIEPSYKLSEEVGVFARYSDVDGARVADEFSKLTLGVNWWLHEDVVLKADIHQLNNDTSAARDEEGYSLGVGFQF